MGIILVNAVNDCPVAVFPYKRHSSFGTVRKFLSVEMMEKLGTYKSLEIMYFRMANFFPPNFLNSVTRYREGLWPLLPCMSSCLCAHHAAAKSLQSCLTLCDPMDGSPPGSPVPGILQARTLEWVAFPSPTHACMLSCFSHVLFYATPWTAAHQTPLFTGFSRQEYWSKLSFPSPLCSSYCMVIFGSPWCH